MILHGTSMAAPFVSGLAALLLADNPTLTPDEIRDKMRYSAEDAGEPGFDNTYGYGRIDAYKALTYKESDENGGNQKAGEVKGEDINEVLSMYEVQRQNRADFTGYAPKRDKTDIKTY